MAKIIIAASGQTIWDVCLQEYGSVNQMGKFLTDNSLGFDAVLTVGQELTIDNENFGNRSVQTFYETRSIKPSSIPSSVADVILELEAQNFVDATGITNTLQKTLINDLVIGLKIDAVWDKLIIIYVFVGGTPLAHSFNLKDTTQFQISWFNTITHDAEGVRGDSITGYGDIGSSPVGVWPDINNSGYTLLCKGLDTGSRFLLGSAPALDETHVVFHAGTSSVDTGTKIHRATNNLRQTIDFTNRKSISAHRDGTNTRMYEGVTQIDSMANEGALNSTNMFILSGTTDGINPLRPSSDQFYGALFHEALDGTERAALEARMNTFNVGLSR